jgi:hypothetical protein
MDETRIVKEALKGLGYRVKVTHGIGTGSGWIKAYIPKPIWEQDRQRVEQMIANAVGRTNEDNNRIVVHWYE